MSTPHRILFLQGPPSAFWRELSLALERRGHQVFKINICLGDQIYWRRLRAANFRGRFKNWHGYLERFLKDERITHILYYGDRLPYHVAAAQVAARCGVVAIAVENGYLRPDWITFERGGMGAFSHFPADPGQLLRIAEQVPEPALALAFPHTFRREISNEIFYHLSSYFYRFLFPFFRSDKYYDPMVDYLSGLRRLWRRSALDRHAQSVADDLLSRRRPFYLAILQLQGDYQIRHNSPYDHLGKMVDEVMESFARFAPSDSRLVFKIHPHDNSREAWPRVVAAAAKRHNVSSRVDTIDGGDLDRLLAAALGMVTVNSTVGLHAIRVRCPLKVLGIAIYDIPGLTHQGTLDEFWIAPQPVDAQLATAFVRALAGAIQVKGSFHDPAGRGAAIAEIVRRLETGQVNEPHAFVPHPPRLARARQLGIAAARNG